MLRCLLEFGYSYRWQGHLSERGGSVIEKLLGRKLLSAKILWNAKTLGAVGIVGMALAAILGLAAHSGTEQPANPPAAAINQQQAPHRVVPIDNHKPGIPDQAYTTLQRIDSGQWPAAAQAPGTKGGDPWNNRQNQLPAKDHDGKPVSYREWDVNPKRAGQSRDAERIVTGSDGTAWYTGDHYRTFTKMR